MRSCFGWIGSVLACLLLGCGALAPEPGDSGTLGAAGSAGTTAGGSGGQASGGGSGGGSSGAAGSGGNAAPPMACSSYADKTGYQLLVRIENKMSRTLYLGQDEASCNVERLFQVADGARVVLPSLDNCHTSCDQMMSSGPVTCPLNCPSPSTVKLDPNQTLQIPWDGRFGVMQTLPATCLAAPATEPATCVQAQRIEPAIFTFSARAGSSLQCLNAGACSCTPNPAGGCTTPGSLIAGTVYTTQYVVKLEPAETSPSGEPPFIGLIFQDTAK
jgi:hypothetical protein